MSTVPVPGRRARTKAANREAIRRAAVEAFTELGYGATTVRDVVRRTTLASGTFYNYYPDKDTLLREILAEHVDEARHRMRAARRGVGTIEAFVEEGVRAYFAFLHEDAQLLALLRRNVGVIRTTFDDVVFGPTIADLAEDLDAAVASGLLPPHDTELVAGAMVGAGLEIVLRVSERDGGEHEDGVRVLCTLLLGGLERLVRDAA